MLAHELLIGYGARPAFARQVEELNRSMQVSMLSDSLPMHPAMG
jgi:hypothetical protein